MDSAVELIAYLMTGLQRWHLNNFNIKQTFPKGRKGAKKGNDEAIPRLPYIMSYIISEYQELFGNKKRQANSNSASSRLFCMCCFPTKQKERESGRADGHRRWPIKLYTPYARYVITRG